MNELMHFNKAKRELALATKIDEVKEIRDRAEALRIYAKQAGEGLVMQNQCAEIKIRAERRGGELLGEQIPHKGGKPSQGVTVTKDFGITRMQSSRWQQIASIPEEKFEEHITTVKSLEEELTSIGVRRFARKLGQEKFIRKFDEKIEYAKEHPEEVPVGKIYYDKSKAGYDIRFQVVGEFCGLPMIKWDCLDPEYIELKKNETLSKICYPIDQAIATLEMAVSALRGVYKRYGNRIKTAYEVSCDEGKKCLYYRLMRAWGELNKIMEKIEQEPGKCIEVKQPKPSSWIEGVRPGWTTWGAENPLRDIQEEARKESEELE